MSKKLYVKLVYWGPIRGNHVQCLSILPANINQCFVDVKSSKDFDAFIAEDGEVTVVHQGYIVKTYPTEDALACALLLQGYDLSFWRD